MSKYEPIDLSKVKTYSIKGRKSKVNKKDFAQPYKKGSSFKNFINTLPDILAGKAFDEIICGIAEASRKKKPVILSFGAHVIKCGLSPVIIDLIKSKVISAIALNGAGSVHDVETALYGFTSEDVFEGMKSGNFGMAKETGEFLNHSATEAYNKKIGLGERIGQKLLEVKAPFNNVSILANAYKNDIPVTVHLAIGADINHMQPSCDGAAEGAATFYDFKVFINQIKNIGNGGVILNFGSAVQLPTVIEKAITVARNLGYNISDFMGVNFDFIRHYRADMNLVQRVKYLGGKGYFIAGHHELMIPLLFAAVKERLP